MALAGYAATAVVTFLFLEGASRLLHGGRRPMLPYVTDAAEGPRMPRRFDADIQFARGEPVRVCTDDYGLRMARCDEPTALQPTVVLSVGDSQAFGWGLAFEHTYAALVAQRLGGDAPVAVRSMAAAGSDVETLAAWAADYRAQSAPVPHALNLIAVNIGNDLDEMYFGRMSARVPNAKPLSEWLTTHSYFMLDFAFAKRVLFGQSEWQLPPGANPVLFALNAGERDRLARACADAVERLAAALPPATRTVVLILPADYQIAAGEFDKYRPFYDSPAQFDGWRNRIAAAASALDRIGGQLAEDLRARGYTVAVPDARLRSADPARVFDRQSHHITAAGQQLLADSVFDALGAP